jgi:hypothetical protein
MGTIPAVQPVSPAPAGSFLSKVKVDVEKLFSSLESDAAKFCAAFKKIFGAAPNALQTVDNFVSEVAPVVVAAVSLADPLVEPAVAAALSTVQVGLAGIQAAATAAVSGTSLVSNLQAFAAQVPTLLGDLDVKNPKLASTIERIVTLVVGEAKVLIPAAEAWAAKLSGSTLQQTA